MRYLLMVMLLMLKSAAVLGCESQNVTILRIRCNILVLLLLLLLLR